MKAGPTTIADLIYENLTLDHMPIKITRLVEQVIKEYFPEIDPIEKASEWEAQVRSRLLTYIKMAEERGIQPNIAFNSSSGYMIQGACFIEGTDIKDIVEQKKRRLSWRQYYETMQELSPLEFEMLCTSVLKLIGAGLRLTL